MTGAELLYKIVIVWNKIPKPASRDDAKCSVDQIITKVNRRTIDTPNDDFAGYEEISGDFDDVDVKLITDMMNQIGKKLNLNFLCFLAHFYLGVNYLDVEGDVEAALESYRKAQDLFFDKLSEQLYYGNIALAYGGVEDWDNAITYLEMALTIAESRGDEESIGIYFQNKGVAHRFKGELEEARTCYKKALAISERKNDQFLSTRRNNLKAIELDIQKSKFGIEPVSRIISVDDPSPANEIRWSRKLRVFLCHSHKDKDEVLKVFHNLRNENIDPWIDEYKLMPGSNWNREIMNEIRESDSVIVCLSNRMIQDQSYYQLEIDTAVKVAENMRDSIYLIPVKLERCDIPTSLSAFQCVEYYKSGGHAKLIRSLQLRSQQLQIA